ncbi:unnamed protein product [Blepharisma stoltei]|uniref:Uncharacterized protein n=1 Tax=Blepharisma stoltei TaxID=1481888 RepID=A0AAU9I6Z3_9CILI|nr:unnamed protein product [Blepharisma stoltei]
MENEVINSLLRCVRQMSPVRETYPPTEKSWFEGLRFKSAEPKYSDYYILNSPQRKSLVPKLELDHWNLNTAKKRLSPDFAKSPLKTPETAESFYSGKASPFKDSKSPHCSSPSQLPRYSGRDTSISAAASKKITQDSMQQIYMSFDDDFSPEKRNFEKEIRLEEEQNKHIKELRDNIEKYEKLRHEGTRKQENKICEVSKEGNDNYEGLVEKISLMKEESLRLRKAIGIYKNKEGESLKRINRKSSMI